MSFFLLIYCYWATQSSEKSHGLRPAHILIFIMPLWSCMILNKCHNRFMFLHLWNSINSWGGNICTWYMDTWWLVLNLTSLHLVFLLFISSCRFMCTIVHLTLSIVFDVLEKSPKFSIENDSQVLVGQIEFNSNLVICLNELV